MHAHTSIHNPSGPDRFGPGLLPSFATIKRRKPPPGKASLHLYCVYWTVVFYCSFVLVAGTPLVSCADVKLGLSRCYFWMRLLSQLKPVCGEIIHVNCGALQRQYDLINQVTQQ